MTTEKKLLALLTVVLALLPQRSSFAQIETTFTEPVISSDLAAAEPGIVRAIHVKEGQYVKKGQVVAELDNNVLQHSLKLTEARAESEAQIRVANARLRISQQRINSLQKLDRNGHANPREVQIATGEYEQAEAELQSAIDEKQVAELEVERIKAQIEQRIIRSPFDGYITDLHKTVGEYVSNAQPEIATIVVLSTLKARFYLSENRAMDIKVGDQLPLKIGNKTGDVTVTFVSPIINADSRTVRVEVQIDNQHRTFSSGATCSWPQQVNVSRSANEPDISEDSLSQRRPPPIVRRLGAAPN